MVKRKGWHGERRRHAKAARKGRNRSQDIEEQLELTRFGSVDSNTTLARRNIKKKYGSRISNIRFGQIRADGTRGASAFLDGNKISWSYLTDI